MKNVEVELLYFNKRTLFFLNGANVKDQSDVSKELLGPSVTSAASVTTVSN